MSARVVRLNRCSDYRRSNDGFRDDGDAVLSVNLEERRLTPIIHKNIHTDLRAAKVRRWRPEQFSPNFVVTLGDLTSGCAIRFGTGRAQ
jgi:hypothetical protein